MTNEKIKAYKGNSAGTIFGLMEHIRPKKCKMVNGGNRMTNKEAIEMFKTISIVEILKLNKIVIDALEKSDKYRWHDLRKNPDDLPEDNGYGKSEYVLVMIGTPEWYSCEWAYYSHNAKMWSTYDQNIFAWRYIEPFKEEEECVSD